MHEDGLTPSCGVAGMRTGEEVAEAAEAETTAPHVEDRVGT